MEKTNRLLKEIKISSAQYIIETGGFTASEKGLYIDIIMYMHQYDKMTEEDIIGKFGSFPDKIKKLFFKKEGLYCHEYIKLSNALSEKRVQAGKLGSISRWGKKS